MQLNFPLILSVISILSTIFTVITAYNMIKFKLDALEQKVKNLESQTLVGLNDQALSFYNKIEAELKATNRALEQLRNEFTAINAVFKYKNE